MFSWFLTRNGRLFTHVSLGLATASAFTFPIALNGPFLDKYKSIFQLYERGKPKPLDPEVLMTAEKVLNECDLSESQKKQVKFFKIFGQDVFHAGGTNSPWGAIIGLPFTFESQEKLVIQELRIVGKEDNSLDWWIQAPDLMEYFTLPYEAQAFAIAKEIYSADIYRVFESALVNSFFLMFFPAVSARRINMAYKTFQYPLSTRLGIYAALYAVGFILFNCVKDPTKHIFERKCDEKAAKLGPNYLQGGIVYYEKILARNKELRNFLGKKGESLFTKDGDENYYFLFPKLSTSKRLEHLQKLENKTQKL